MKPTKRFLYFLPLYSFDPETVRNGKNNPVGGGNDPGSEGAVTYSSGKLVYQVMTGITRSVIQGVQQPFEISVATVIEKPEDLNMEYKVYPNKVTKAIRLVIRPFEGNNMSFRLYDMNGVLLMDKKIENQEIAISMDNFSSAPYLMKVVKDNTEVRVFKIIKK